jgi:hypothetical protein
MMAVAVAVVVMVVVMVVGSTCRGYDAEESVDDGQKHNPVNEGAHFLLQHARLKEQQ